MSPITSDDLLNKQRTARTLAISMRHLDNLLHARAIECVKIGRSVRFTPEAVAKFKASRTVKALT